MHEKKKSNRFFKKLEKAGITDDINSQDAGILSNPSSSFFYMILQYLSAT